MRTRIWPVAVIPVWIPFRSSARIELLNVASRIVSNQKSLSEDTAVFACIEVEALYLERSRGFDRNSNNLESSGGYIRRITALTSIIRDKYGPKDGRPTIEFEKYVLQPGSEGPNVHVLEGEIGIAWPAEPGSAADPDPDSSRHFATKELGKLILNKVQMIHPLLFTVQKTISVNRPPKAVVGSMTTCTIAAASWQNQAAVIQGELNLSMNLEYDDGTLGRWFDPIKYQVPEPLVPNYANSLYVFIDQCHVDPRLTTDTDQIEIAATVTGIIAETCPKAVSLHAPIITSSPYFKTLRIIGASDCPISCQNKELSGTFAIPGTPTGHLTYRFVCGRLERTGGSLLQELTALCDLFYVDAEGEKCLEIQLTDIMLTPVGNYPPTASYSGNVFRAGEPIISADLRNPGKFSLTVPYLYQVAMRETKVMDAYVGTVEEESGKVSDTVGAMKAIDSARTVDAVVEEIVAQKQINFLVEFPGQTEFPPATKRLTLSRPLSEPMPELAFECLPETDSCLIKGRVNLASYVTALDGKAIYQPAGADFCEKVFIPGCRPDLKHRCNLEATVVDPATQAGTPSVLIEADIVLFHYRRARILAEVSAQSAESAESTQSRQPGYSKKSGSGDSAKPDEPDKQLFALEHRLFWQSKHPSGTIAEPVRIDAKADDLRWRLEDDFLIIDGMVGRELYFVDRDQRLYCSNARIPFRMAALLSGQMEDIRQIRIQRIDGMALPRAKKGVQLCLEEEYRIFMEIIRKT